MPTPVLISVVIPCYNALPWLPETLASVLAQGDCVTEIIVVDDSSTDGSIELVTSQFPQIRVLHSGRRGPSYARNLGWQAACGEWIQFLDADDLLAPGKLATQSAVAQLAPDTVSMLYSDWQRYHCLDQIWQPLGSICRPRLEIDPIARLISTAHFVQLGAALFRRTWLEQIGGFNPEYWLIEDVDLMLRLAMQGTHFCHVATDEPLFFYRQHSTSLSRRNQRAFIDGCVRNASMVEDYWCSQGVLTQYQRDLLTRIYFQAARSLVSEDRKAFEAVVQKIERLSPQLIPPGPRILRILSYVCGYRQAEALALQYRSAKAMVVRLRGSPIFQRRRSLCR